MDISGKEAFSSSFKLTSILTHEFVSFQIDYFGIVNTAYVILFGNYMNVIKNKEDKYFPSGSFKRWWDIPLWTEFFTAFMNIPSCNELPDLKMWRQRFETTFCEKKLKNFSSITSTVFT